MTISIDDDNKVTVIEPHSKAFALSNNAAVVANYDAETPTTEPTVVVLVANQCIEINSVASLLQLQKAVDFALYGPRD